MKETKDLSVKWIKMPARGTEEWTHLMGVLMRNINYAIANVLISNPDFEGFKHEGKRLLTHIKENHGKCVHFHRAVLECYPYHVRSFGLGIFLKSLQPYMLPFVKIAKHKIGKEFRAFLVEACKKVRKRKDVSESYWGTSWRSFGSFQVVSSLSRERSNSTAHWMRMKGFKRQTDILQQSMTALGSQMPTWPWTKWVTICRNSEGRAVLGVNAHGNCHIITFAGLQRMKDPCLVPVRKCKGIKDLSTQAVRTAGIEQVTAVADIEWERMTQSGKKTHLKS